ncbi:MgtC/SapB family protein [Brevundimonas nasdae]|uniref:MgtC/SapB family protein n=2 Tax=Brevundimonas nasdae TaxID=172043 RepID=UPI00191378F2|nr:MgtC/SapB family protein [Brevundimonas nasdae]MBK6026461.1 MgtC/SapB family protein [Brevundimonas nasdae]
MMPLENAVLPILGAVAAGSLIGFEREWRGRAAGLRTHILVSLASALLMLAAMSQGDWAFRALPDENIVTDPTRMAHGVLTGVGFLCAGVIFRSGFSIHGLTTAASLWMTSALGLLFGAGLFGLGLAGTLATAFILIGLRLVRRRLPIRLTVDVDVSWEKDAACEEEVERALLAVNANARPGRIDLTHGGSRIRRAWRVQTTGGQHLKTLADRLSAAPGVVEFQIDPRDD